MRTHLITIFIHAALICSGFNISRPLQIALDNLKNRDVRLAVQQIRNAAATNDLLAQYYLAQCYEYGIGMPIDKTQAFAMYRRAAERGLPEAMADLSRVYSYGIGVESNSDKAEVWRQRFIVKNNGEPVPSFISLYNETLLATNTSSSDDSSGDNTTYKSDVTVVSIENKSEIREPVSGDNTFKVNSNTRNIITTPNNIPKSDIDIDLPKAKFANELLFAFIFANEEYQDVASVPNAINDGESVAKYCNITLGIPLTNIHLVKNATLNNIRREVNHMRQIAAAYKNEASFIIYYAGHGIPDEDTRSAYLFPTDGYPGDLSTCYSLKELYENVGKLNVKRNFIIFDACFSGSNRNNEMITSSRGVVIAPKPNKPSGNTIVIASSQGNETSHSYEEMQHGLFTYYLLKKIKESKGETTLGSLVDFVAENVSKKSIVINGKPQNPNVNLSSEIDKDWRSWKLK